MNPDGETKDVVTGFKIMANDVRPGSAKSYDYLLKFLLVGDSDVGKSEIMNGLEEGNTDSPFSSGAGETFFSVLLCESEWLTCLQQVLNFGIVV